MRCGPGGRRTSKSTVWGSSAIVSVPMALTPHPQNPGQTHDPLNAQTDDHPVESTLFTGNYMPADFVLERGQGCTLWDRRGNAYLDMTAGIAVCALGHGDPGMARVLAEQASKLLHVSNLYYNAPSLRLVELLSQRAFKGKAFFCNSGAEANESALKLARRYQSHVARAPHKTKIVACEKSFHGRTMGALSVTGQPKYHEGFGPLLPGVTFVPFGDAAAADAAIDDETAAVIVEPIQAEGGIFLPPPGYLAKLGALCAQRGALLIFDEVQTGIGRTGTFYAFEREAVKPDILTLAKGIAGGVPMGAMLAADRVAEAFVLGTHASTFGGNPLASAAAAYVLESIESRGLLEHVRKVGGHLSAALARLAEKRRPKTVGARGRGCCKAWSWMGLPGLWWKRPARLGCC